MTEKGTPRPWHYYNDDGCAVLLDANNRLVAYFGGTDPDWSPEHINARLANTAVNAHDRLQREHEKAGELVEAAEQVRDNLWGSDSPDDWSRLEAAEVALGHALDHVRQARGEGRKGEG